MDTHAGMDGRIDRQIAGTGLRVLVYSAGS